MARGRPAVRLFGAANQFKTNMLMVWVLVAVSIGAYPLLGALARTSGTPGATTHLALRLYNPGLIAMAVIVLVIAVMTDRIALSAETLAQAVHSGEAPATRLTLAFVGQMALFEAIAIIGFVHYFLGGSFKHLVNFCVVSWLLMAILLLKLPSYASAARTANDLPLTVDLRPKM